MAQRMMLMETVRNPTYAQVCVPAPDDCCWLAGTVSLAEVMKFVMKANDEMYETAEFATELLSSMDRDMSGTLTR